MKKYFGLIIIILAVVSMATFGVLSAASTEPVQAGVAAAVKGDVSDTAENAGLRLLKSGDKVFMGDMIETGKDSQLQVLLLDETVFTLGPLSAIKMDEFIYDPATADGKVKASMVKGVFRVISGKVAHKTPENMSVDLPAGTIGFRGTNVAGIIDGARTLVVLLGPIGTGRISVSNVVNGEVMTVDIDTAGNATIIDGPNSIPAQVFQVSQVELNQIAAAFGQPAGTPEAAPTGGDMTADGNGSPQTTGTDMDLDKLDSEAAQTTGPTSGATTGTTNVDTATLMDLLNKTDVIQQQSQTAAQDAAKDAAQSSSHESSSSSDNSKSISVGPT